MMRYVLQWPPTLCMTLENGRCKEPIPENEFLLHGLWPADEMEMSWEAPPNHLTKNGMQLWPIPPSPSPSPPPPNKFQEEEYGTYPIFERSWAKYIFNGWI
ncbi:hypothetical protein MTR67_029863 [Solanum verrucosum]|uniref:Uncharacterized protein n=1 Tax=Solanum verrucosum TaxID=315347 RepID=A0AAF0R893_SOLVR|nr:hypothetical protein MTR67_029863 [Solanum verrucosum]